MYVVRRDDVLALVGNGSPRTLGITFSDDVTQPIRGLSTRQIVEAMGRAFRGKGLDLTGVSHAERSGVARDLANKLKVPVRASWGPVLISYIRSLGTS